MVDSVSIRACERDGCENDLDLLGLKATARFCSRSCAREANRSRGDGDETRKWVKGHWRSAKPRRRPPARRAVGAHHHSLGLSSTALAVPGKHSGPQEAFR